MPARRRPQRSPFDPDPSADRWDVVSEPGSRSARPERRPEPRPEPRPEARVVPVEAALPGSLGGPAEGPADGPGPDDVLSVPQVAARIRDFLGRAFPAPFWMMGEVSNLKRHGTGHWYLQLVDDEAGDPRKRASLSAKMWRDTVQRLFGPRGRLAGVLDPEDGLKLKVLVRPDFYAPRGEISFTIQDVDADATLGDLDRQRREALANLQRDGALGWNKSVALAPVPLVIGLITARDSAAENDFLQTLAASGLGFHVLRCDARMQGQDTSASVRGALRSLARGVPVRGGGRVLPELIVIARGGGSRLDLSWFDREDIAREVATCALPVFTGIGHEIDTSVTDAVAMRAFKTPTAVAEFLVTTARDAWRAGEEAWEAILESARRRLADHDAALIDTGRRAQQAVTGAIAAATESLVLTGQRIRSGAEAVLQDRHHELRAAHLRLTQGPHLAALPRHAERLVSDTRRLSLGSRARLAAAEQGLAAAESRCRLLDPTAVLRRGYSLLRGADGKLIKDAAAVQPGAHLTARLRDGELDLDATGRRLDPAGGDLPGDESGT